MNGLLFAMSSTNFNALKIRTNEKYLSVKLVGQILWIIFQSRNHEYHKECSDENVSHFKCIEPTPAKRYKTPQNAVKNIPKHPKTCKNVRFLFFATGRAPLWFLRCRGRSRGRGRGRGDCRRHSWPLLATISSYFQFRATIGPYFPLFRIIGPSKIKHTPWDVHH